MGVEIDRMEAVQSEAGVGRYWGTRRQVLPLPYSSPQIPTEFQG